MALWMWLLHPSLVILGHHISRRLQFVAGCRSCLTLAHSLNVGLHGVYGCPVTLDVMALMAHSQGKRKPRKSGQKQNSK